MGSKGFTLIELMAVLSIAAILAVVGMPAISNMIEHQHSRAIGMELTTLFSHARQSALDAENMVTICGSSDQVHCDRAWLEGILIFVDGGTPGLVDDDDHIIQYRQPVSKGELRWRAFQNKPYLQYRSDGSTNYHNGNLTYCPPTGKAAFAKQLIVNPTGRVRLAQDSDGNGIPNDSQGNDIEC